MSTPSLHTCRWLYFYSGGYLASVAQGVAHHIAGKLAAPAPPSYAHNPAHPRTFSLLQDSTALCAAGEVGTLPQLSDVGAELSHTTFFPNILLQSVRQSLLSGRGEAP